MPNHIACKLPISSLDVVVIDDNQSTRQILETTLVDLRVNQIRFFTDGESALEEITESPPNLLIADSHVKPINGYQIVRAMRHESSKSLCLVPVIMMLGFTSRHFVQKSFEAGAHQIISKPVTSSALLKGIKWILQDERDMVLQNGYYVCSDTPGPQKVKTLENKTVTITPALHEQNRARQSVISRTVKPVHTPLKTTQADDSSKDQWEL